MYQRLSVFFFLEGEEKGGGGVYCGTVILEGLRYDAEVSVCSFEVSGNQKVIIKGNVNKINQCSDKEVNKNGMKKVSKQYEGGKQRQCERVKQRQCAGS